MLSRRAILAAIGGLFSTRKVIGGSAEMKWVNPIDTTTMHTKRWATKVPPGPTGDKFQVYDGYEFFRWPECEAFLKYLGVTEDQFRTFNGFEFTLKCDELVKVKFFGLRDSTALTEMVSGVDGFTAYSSEEFINLCHRMNVPWELLSKWISMTLREGHEPLVTHVFRPNDMLKE